MTLSGRILVHLKTLGHPTLRRADGTLAAGLRRKDVALLVYLCVEGGPAHARSRLAALLWGESPEERARHSLTQALGRLVRMLPAGVLVPDKETVRWSAGLACDADTLLRGDPRPDEVDDAFSLYAGHFLEGFDPGAGTEDFRDWADRRRAELRNAALRLLERAGEQAEAACAWSRALRLGERAVEIDPVWEQGHRRIMRALAARGERNGALRHYQRFHDWLDAEVGGDPDPDTRALAHQLRTYTPPAPSLAPEPEPEAEREAESGRHAEVPAPTLESAQSPDSPVSPDSPASPASAEAPEPGVPVVMELEEVAGGVADAAPPHGPPPLAQPRGHRSAAFWQPGLLIVMVAALGLAAALQKRAGHAPGNLPAHGESVRLRGSSRTYLAFRETLYEYPDQYTLSVCTGRYPGVVREASALPPWPRTRLPSALQHAWIGGQLPVVSDHPVNKTAYVAVGCVLPGVPTAATLDSIFGPQSLGRMLQVPDSVLTRLPRSFVARGHPLRPAGTLIRGPHDRIRWITYHGGALEVTDPELLASHCRSPHEAVPVDEREYAYYRPWGTLTRGPRDCTP